MALESEPKGQPNSVTASPTTLHSLVCFKELETTSSLNVIPAGAEGSALLAAIYDVPLAYFVTLPADTRTDGKYLGKTDDEWSTYHQEYNRNRHQRMPQPQV